MSTDKVIEAVLAHMQGDCGSQAYPSRGDRMLVHHVASQVFFEALQLAKAAGSPEALAAALQRRLDQHDAVKEHLAEQTLSDDEGEWEQALYDDFAQALLRGDADGHRTDPAHVYRPAAPGPVTDRIAQLLAERDRRNVAYGCGDHVPRRNEGV